MTNLLKKISVLAQIFANLFQLPSQITLIEKFDVKVYLQELQNKIELSDIKSGNSLRNISQIALIFDTLTHNNILHWYL